MGRCFKPTLDSTHSNGTEPHKVQAKGFCDAFVIPYSKYCQMCVDILKKNQSRQDISRITALALSAFLLFENGKSFACYSMYIFSWFSQKTQVEYSCNCVTAQGCPVIPVSPKVSEQINMSVSGN